MSRAYASRAASLLLLLVFLQPRLAVAEGNSRPRPEVGSEPPLLTGDAEHDRIILIAGAEEEPASRERPQVEKLEDGTSSRRVKKAAIDSLGLNRLPWQNQELAQAIVDEVSIFRRLPAYRGEVDPRVHDFFLHNPDVAVSIWRAMGISQLQMWRTGDWSFGMDTKDGTTGTINVLYRSRESCLILCNGMFKSPYLQNAIAARSLMHLRTSFTTGEQGRTFATHRADMFVSFPSQKVETVAKLVSPVSNMIVDRNFHEISLFVHVMWLAMGRQPGWVEQMAESLDGIAEERQKELVDLTAKVYVAIQTALRRQSGETVTIDDIRPPAQSAETHPVSAEASEPNAVVR